MSRSDMVDDLRSHHLSPGMTRHEVRRLLGKPDYSIGGDFWGRGIWWDYLTGADLVDCSTLGLRFKNGRLEQMAIGQT
jgi:outer membrane protein assembly factor BamE (lipoprotein component of BamABCDE complex)